MTNDEASGMKNDQFAHTMKESIARHWIQLPKEVRGFLLETPLESLDLHQFAEFWSSPMGIKYARSPRAARSVRDASFSIAWNYLCLGKMREARALMLNGIFMLECTKSRIESIAERCREDVNVRSLPELKHFTEVFNSIKTPAAMEKFLQQMIQEIYDSSPKPEEVMKFIGIANDCGYSAKRHRKHSSEMSPGSNIYLIIMDNASAEECHQTLNIGSSTTLRTLFDEYAEKRGVSLRSLRFSYNEKTLFLSSAGKKTPDELSMKDQDVITVFDTNNLDAQEVSSSSSSIKKKTTSRKQHTKTQHNSRKTRKGKGNINKEDSKHKEIDKLKDHMTHHSKMLSKLHEEIQPLLKEIRMRLNALDLKRQLPKRKRKNKGKKEAKGNVTHQMIPPNSGLGGKAGKPYFNVQVGEVQNLYKTDKSRRRNLHIPSTLDLHGCTRDEALKRLNESLGAWVDTAMRGSYPFVIPARIICGCGNQILSETVEEWIRYHDHVAKSPKGFCW